MRERDNRPLQLFETLTSIATCIWLTRLAFNAFVHQNKRSKTITRDNFEELGVPSEREFAKHYFKAHPEGVLFHEPFLVQLTEEERQSAGVEKMGHLPDFATSRDPEKAAIIEATWGSLTKQKMQQQQVMEVAGFGEHYTQVRFEEMKALQNSNDINTTLRDVTGGLL